MRITLAVMTILTLTAAIPARCWAKASPVVFHVQSVAASEGRDHCKGEVLTPRPAYRR